MVNFEKIVYKVIVGSQINTTFVITVPVLHTIRTASGSFFLYSYVK